MFSQEPLLPEIIRKNRSQTIKTKVLIVGGGPAGIGAAIGAPTLTETGNLSPKTLLLNIGKMDNYTSKDMSGVVRYWIYKSKSNEDSSGAFQGLSPGTNRWSAFFKREKNARGTGC